MKHLPWYLIAGFIIITLITLFALYKATGKSKLVLLLCSGWLLLQAIISSSGFYTVTDVMPPRFLLALLFPIVLILWLLLSKRGKQFTASHSLKYLTLLHTIRILVELGLYSLSVHKVIPELMTFEGRNFDIIAGLTAPLIWYFGFIRKKLSTTVILAWNFICIALLANIVIHAVLAAPFPFQQLAFEQPNIAILYFPFIWLPCFIVPVVLYAHLVSIQRLIKNKSLAY
jgi:hypothetical protein